VGLLRGREASYTDVKGYLADADLVAHSEIVSRVGEAYPGERVLSEEGDPLGMDARTSGGPLWIADPICGTTNFVRGMPFYSHSLCVVEEGEVLAAGVYAPAFDEMFLSDGASTRLNGVEVQVSGVRSMSEAIISVNCNQADCAEGDEKFLTLHGLFAPPLVRRQRIMESANLELAFVACGRLDGYVNPEDNVWDIASGILLVAAAGGIASPLEGSLIEPLRCRGVIAGNSNIAPALLKRIRSTRFAAC